MIKRFLAALASVALIGAGLAGTAPAQAAPVKPVAPIAKPVSRPAGVQAMKSMSGPLVHKYVAAVMAAGTGTPVPAGTTGQAGRFTIEQPTVDVAGGDYFSLMQIGAAKTITTGGVAQRNIIEIGWEVNPPHYGDTNPHVFTGAWKHGTFLGRNAAGGFVDIIAATPNAGDSILASVGTQKEFSVIYDSTTPAGGGWWIGYTTPLSATNWIGYYPSSIWTNAGPSGLPVVTGFTGLDEAQWFGEVVVDSLGAQATDMGDGQCGSAGTVPLSQASDPAFITTMRTFQGSSTYTNANTYNWDTDPGSWDHNRLAGSAYTIGGGGAGTC